MSTVAILGAGPLGAAVAHRLAERGRVREIVVIDSSEGIGAGKALDIRQSCAIAGVGTRLSAASDPLAAASASAVVVADDTSTGEWAGERGLALIARLARAGTSAPFVFAGAGQVWLQEAAAREVRLPGDRLVGTAASGLASAIAAVTAVEAGRTGVDVVVAGRPPALVVAWSAATAGGALVTSLVPAHRLLAISQAIPRLWPPGPQTSAAPTAGVVEALIHGSRRRHLAAAILDGEWGVRGLAAMLPLDLGEGRVRHRDIPALSPQERTDVLNGLAAARP